MSVVDYFLNSLVKYLQKKQKVRKKRKKIKRRLAKKSRKSKRPRPKKKPIKTKKRPIKKLFKRSVRRKKKKKTVRPKKKVVKKKKIKKTAKKPPIEKKLLKEPCIGEVTHYFSRIQVIVLKMTKGKLHVGEKIHIKGRKTDFFQTVKSLQIESIDVKVARKGQIVGLKVNKVAKQGDKVFKPER